MPRDVMQGNWAAALALVEANLAEIVNRANVFRKREAKTGCPVRGAAEMQKCVVIAASLNRAASAATGMLDAAEAMFNTWLHLDKAESLAGDVPMEDIIVRLRGDEGDSLPNPLSGDPDVLEFAERISKLQERITAANNLASEVIEPARAMTIKEFDEYRAWLAKEKPELLPYGVDTGVLVPGGDA